MCPLFGSQTVGVAIMMNMNFTIAYNSMAFVNKWSDFAFSLYDIIIDFLFQLLHNHHFQVIQWCHVSLTIISLFRLGNSNYYSGCYHSSDYIIMLRVSDACLLGVNSIRMGHDRLYRYASFK